MLEVELLDDNREPRDFADQLLKVNNLKSHIMVKETNDATTRAKCAFQAPLLCSNYFRLFSLALLQMLVYVFLFN